MKNRMLLLAVILFLFNACQKQEAAEPPLLVGKWQMIASQNASGQWQDVSVATVMRIYANGKIRYFDTAGDGIIACCQPSSYNVEGHKVVFADWEFAACPFVLCVLIKSWDIVTLDQQILEVTTNTGQYRIRYKRVG